MGGGMTPLALLTLAYCFDAQSQPGLDGVQQRGLSYTRFSHQHRYATLQGLLKFLDALPCSRTNLLDAVTRAAIYLQLGIKMLVLPCQINFSNDDHSGQLG